MGSRLAVRETPVANQRTRPAARVQSAGVAGSPRN